MKQKKNQVPQSDNADSSVRVFDSFEQMNEADHEYYASLTPEQSLAVVTKMRLTMCPELNSPDFAWEKNIVLDR